MPPPCRTLVLETYAFLLIDSSMCRRAEMKRQPSSARASMESTQQRGKVTSLYGISFHHCSYLDSSCQYGWSGSLKDWLHTGVGLCVPTLGRLPRPFSCLQEWICLVYIMYLFAHYALVLYECDIMQTLECLVKRTLWICRKLNLMSEKYFSSQSTRLPSHRDSEKTSFLPAPILFLLTLSMSNWAAIPNSNWHRVRGTRVCVYIKM